MTTAIDLPTQLAFTRTRAALDRTMQAWMRTGMSLITFGFSVYKFFQIEHEEHQLRHRLVGPREFALVIVCVGLLSLMLGTLEYRRNIVELRKDDPALARSWITPAVAIVMCFVGLGVLLAVYFRQ